MRGKVFAQHGAVDNSGGCEGCLDRAGGAFAAVEGVLVLGVVAELGGRLLGDSSLHEELIEELVVIFHAAGDTAASVLLLLVEFLHGSRQPRVPLNAVLSVLPFLKRPIVSCL